MGQQPATTQRRPSPQELDIVIRILAIAAVLIVMASSTVLFGAVQVQVISLAVAALAIVGALVLAVMLRNRTPLPRDPLFLAVLLFPITAGLSTFWSINPYLTLEWTTRLVAFAVIYGVAAHVTPGRSAARIITAVSVCIALATAYYGLWVVLTGAETVLWVAKEAYRDSLTGTFINRNHFAAFLGLNVFVGLGLFASATRKLRFLLLLPLSGCLLALLLTLSRGGLLAFALALPLFVYLLSPEKRRSGILVGLALAVALTGLLATKGGRLFDRIEGSFDPAGEPSAVARLSVWTSSLHAARDRPLVGYGAGTFRSLYPTFREPEITRRVEYAHQEYVEHIAELGALGLITLIASGILFWRAVPGLLTGAVDDRPIVAGLVAGITTVAFAAVVDFPLKIPAIAMATALALGLLTALGGDRYRVSLTTVWSRRLSIVGVVLLLLTTGRALQSYFSDWNYRQARAVFERPAWDEAAISFEKAVRIDPINPYAWKGLAHSEMNRAKFRRREGMEARRNYAEAALTHLATADRLDPMLGDYNLDRAWMFNFLGRNEEAAVEYDLAVAGDPANANVLFHAGMFHLNRGSRERGIELMKRGIAVFPKFFGGKIGVLHHLLKSVDAVLALIPPDQPFLMYQFAVHLITRGNDTAGAVVVFEKAVAVAGWQPHWVVPFAGMVAQAESPAAAIALYERVPEESRTAQFANEVSRLHVANGDKEASIAVLIEACSRFPTDRALLQTLVGMSGDEQPVRDAIARYRTQSGEDLGYHVAAGLLALARDDQTVARVHFETGLGISPNDPYAVAGAIRTYRELAEIAESKNEPAAAVQLETLATDLENASFPK